MSKISKVHARQVFDSRGNPTIEEDLILLSNVTSASIVGFPLLSNTCLAWTLIILLTNYFLQCYLFLLVVLINFLD